MKAALPEHLSPLGGSDFLFRLNPMADALGFILSAAFGGSKSTVY
jgi:hypothetical protein